MFFFLLMRLCSRHEITLQPALRHFTDKRVFVTNSNFWTSKVKPKLCKPGSIHLLFIGTIGAPIADVDMD